MLAGQSHRRLNPLTGEWVLVSPHRMQRPWQGSHDAAAAPSPGHDPGCYLCPGNVRFGGERNPAYEGAFVFPNDFPALNRASVVPPLAHELFRADVVAGECRVLCYSPRHDASLRTLSLESITGIVRMWSREWTELSGRADISAVTIFENRGQMMGASSAHPHGQLWATSVLPNEVEKELRCQQEYFARHSRPLLLDYLDRELALAERIVCRSNSWVAHVPFWATWPFELIVLPTRELSGFDQLTAADQGDLAALLQNIAAIYDGLFGVPFPYSMGWHARPCDGGIHPEWMLHAHFYPPLLRSASVRKFLVGFELLGMPQRDLTPESAAAVLRGVTSRLERGVA
jgi:UDPglucose--hexose-1-phosphate uridylyltransferase